MLKRLVVLGSLLGACGTPDTTQPPEQCLNISGEIDANGLMIRRPEDEPRGCVETPGAREDEKLCTPKAPDFTCLGTADPLGTPINVTFTGCVASFGLAAPSYDLVVSLMRESIGGARTDPGYDLTGAAGAQAEKSPNAFIAEAVSTTVPPETCLDRGLFAVEGIPTETPLIVRVTDKQFEKRDRTFVDTYQYNVVLRNRNLRMGPSLTDPVVTDPATYCAANRCYAVDDVNAVYKVTFGTVATTAGVSNIQGDDDLYDGMGQGHVAGAVRDCSPDDTVQNAVVALSVKARKTAYFNVGFPPGVFNLEDPKVEQTRTRTNGDGLYAAIALDTPAGGIEAQIGAAVTTSICGDDGVCKCIEGAANPAYTAADANEAKTIVLGERRLYVYPDSITILTFDNFLYSTH